MANEYIAITKEDGNWWIGRVEDVPGVNCQEKSREELIEGFRIALREALRLNRQEAIKADATKREQRPDAC